MLDDTRTVKSLFVDILVRFALRFGHLINQVIQRRLEDVQQRVWMFLLIFCHIFLVFIRFYLRLALRILDGTPVLHLLSFEPFWEKQSKPRHEIQISKAARQCTRMKGEQFDRTCMAFVPTQPNTRTRDDQQKPCWQSFYQANTCDFFLLQVGTPSSPCTLMGRRTLARNSTPGNSTLDRYIGTNCPTCFA